MDKEKKRIFIQRIQNLPTLPTTLARIVSVAENDSSTAADLAEVISKDQSISSIILRLVNSAFYGHLRQVSSIPQSIVILGFNTVKTMALGVSIFQSGGSLKKQSFDRRQFWIHSIGVATIAKKITSAVSPGKGVDKDTVFLSGLLHDLGKVVFDNYFNEEFEEVAKTAQAHSLWIGDVEMELLGMDHTEAGEHLANKWQFPPAVIEVIKYHHSPEEAPGENGSVASIVHLADHYCRLVNLGSGGDYTQTELSQSAIESLGLLPDQLVKIVESVLLERDSIEGFALD